MGISGLLPVLKSITEDKTIDEYRGQTLAIDGYCWLHRAIYSCSQEICLGHKTDKYVTYFMDQITTLLHHGISPYVVFDGGPLPMKQSTEEERRKSRQKYRELGIQYYKDKRFSEARKCFIRAADVSPFMAHQVIQRLKAEKIAYIVAPYEADAQLAYLVKNGLANGVISEDSDCLLFGCQTVLFKMDRNNVAQEIEMANLKKNKGMSFHMFTEQMFLEMCIFSGCDYLPSIPGFGLKKAYLAIKQHGSVAKIIRALRLEGKVRIPASYEDNFRKAVLTFTHQRVYCPIVKRVVPLTPIPADVMEADPAIEFVGPMLSNEVAMAIANGNMDPISKRPFPALIPQLHRSIIQPRAAKPLMQSIDKLPNVSKPKQAITPSKSVAAAVCTTPCTGSILKKRELSSPFKDKWATKRKSIKKQTAQLTVSNAVACPDADSPQMTSRFFGVNSMMSPPEESIKKCVLHALNSSSLEPCKVETTQNVSIELPKDKSNVLSTEDLKENIPPNCQKASPRGSNLKETAFSRMMRAGSMLRQYKLKNGKRTGPANQSGTLHNASLTSRIGQFNFSGNKMGKPTRISNKKSDVNAERLTNAKRTSESINDRLCSPTTSIKEIDVKTEPMKPTLEALQQDIDATRVQASKVPTPSFGQFRFKN